MRGVFPNEKNYSHEVSKVIKCFKFYPSKLQQITTVVISSLTYSRTTGFFIFLFPFFYTNFICILICLRLKHYQTSIRLLIFKCSAYLTAAVIKGNTVLWEQKNYILIKIYLLVTLLFKIFKVEFRRFLCFRTSAKIVLQKCNGKVEIWRWKC